MLYWICPECGGECSPAIRECPACAGTRATSPASAVPVHRKPGVTEEVLALVQSLQPPSPAPFPTRGLASGNGHSPRTATLELPEPPVQEERSAPPQEAIESLVRPLIESTTLAPPPEAPPEPVVEALAPHLLSNAMALQAELVLDSMAQQMARQDLPERSAIRGIVASFQQLSHAGLLAPPAEVVTAPAPPCLQWMRIPRPRLLPVPPKNLNPGDLMSGLQTPPLAGPTVPIELRNLTDQHRGRRSQAREKAGLPAWTVSFVVALTLFLGVGGLLQYLAANRDAKAASSASQPPDTSGSVVQSSEQTPSKLVEVTGLRVAAGPNHRPQLEFIVVNHSATQFSGIGLQIAVRSASSSAGVAPLFRVSTTIASLGPYQSREFRAELDPEVHTAEIPDWQTLRADVHIASQ